MSGHWKAQLWTPKSERTVAVVLERGKRGRALLEAADEWDKVTGALILQQELLYGEGGLGSRQGNGSHETPDQSTHLFLRRPLRHHHEPPRISTEG